jgi:GNAT superfamily N-acetyltransferase
MTIEFRTLDYANTAEMRRYLELFYEIPAELDAYYAPKSSDFIASCIATAREQEDATNTFCGIALAQGEIVGLHILRRFQEGDLIGVHIAGLWVAEEHRGAGIARCLKERGEAWARSIGASFVNTNVAAANVRMLEINERIGFKPYKINLRKRL